MNELITKPEDTFLALQDGSDVAELIAANFSGGETLTEQDLVQVKTPTGGSTTWEFEDITGTVETKTLEGICVYYGSGGILWPSMEIGSQQTPLLVTNDLIKARKVGDDYGDLDPDLIESFRNEDGSYNWIGLCGDNAPLGFGAGRNGGKRCDEYRNLCLLRAEDTFPIMIRVKAGSFRSVLPFMKKLPVPFYRAVISLSLDKVESQSGNKYSQISPRLIGKLDREQGEFIQKTYTEGLRTTFER